MKLTSLASRVDRLEQYADPKPAIVVVGARPGETREAAMHRARIEHRVRHGRPVLVFCDQHDESL
jgi:hypothetical protein